MKISPLSPKNHSVNFGYNAKYHKKVEKQLSKNHDKRAQAVLNSEKQMLDIEDKIVELEREKKYSSQEYKDLTEMLLDLKPIVAYYIELIDGSLKYCDKVIKNYFIEMDSIDINQGLVWRKLLCKSLNEYTLDDYFPFEDNNPKESEKTQDKQQYSLTIFNPSRDAASDKQVEKTNQLINLYTPNAFSPKGLKDVVGSDDIKDKLTDDLMFYTQNPDLIAKDYIDYGIRAPRGFLFYGPPGCGKTYIAQALAGETGMEMYMMDVSKVGSKYVNQTANNIREAFEFIFSRAQEAQKPIMLFMDEVDALAKDRNEGPGGSGEDSKTTTTLLKMVETARDNNIIVIAATNKYDLLDNAFKDRFDEQIYFPLPDKEQIKSLVTSSLMRREKGASLVRDEESINKLANLLEGFSNRSIVILLDEASKIARKRSRDDITFDDVKNAIEKTEIEKHDERAYKKSSKRKPIGF